MENKNEIHISLIILISFFMHVLIGMSLIMPDYKTYREWVGYKERLFKGGRDIIVNINQDDKRIVTRKTLLSDRDSSAKGYVTKEKGDRWLNNSLEFLRKRGRSQSGKGARSGNNRRMKKEKVLLRDKSEVVVSLMKPEQGGFTIVGEKGNSTVTRIPDRNSINRKNAIFYSNDGKFSFNTKKFKNFKYFKNMKDKIAENWYQLLPTMANVNIGGYAPGAIRVRAIQSQIIKLYFTMNRNGDVLKVVLVDSMGNEPLDRSCIEAIEYSKNFGNVPEDIKGKFIIIPFMFGYFIR